MRYNIPNGAVLPITLNEDNDRAPSRTEGVPDSKTEDGVPEPVRTEGVPRPIEIDDIPAPSQPNGVHKQEGVPAQTSDMGDTQSRAKSKLPDSETDREMVKETNVSTRLSSMGIIFVITRQLTISNITHAN